jgi:hypothetical protein
MAILERFGFATFSERPGGVDQVWNLLSLEHNIRSKFDHLHLWFESTREVCYSETCRSRQLTRVQPGRYKVCVLNKANEGYIRHFVGPKPHVDGAPMVVEFTSEFEKVPPPDPILLALHAICARVAHMSGAAEFFDQLERDAEEMEALALDSSSTPPLSSLICPFAVIPGVA